ncbi:ABC transporter substrate-binding protein [Psychromicrobium xiongbiense]|uniref:ABC transporter substrate-binding protein n=1 Tax=Psychromicrobium xiongbiense TaxID=3051184 RepID=UPI0025534368|nr:ABC transporter substrate-binding protein [Psychromicrobium sp. YIM S02556]
MNIKYLGTAVLVSTALLLTGCVSSANNANSGGSAAAKDRMVVAYSDGGNTLDPAEANDATSDTFVVSAYDQLVTYGRQDVNGKQTAKTDQIVPMLARSWDESSDHTKFTFHLRDDVKFQNGKALTSADVVASFDHIKASKSASFLYQMAGIGSVTAQDPSTVVITLTAANHLFLQILPMYSFSIVDMDQANKNGGSAWLGKNVAGSGPYKIDSWDPATAASLSRNDAYWGDKPALAKVDMKFIADASNREQLLKQGQVDVAMDAPAKDVNTLKTVAGISIDSRASNKILFFAMNNQVAPFDNEKVRQAINYAIPYDKLINDVMQGQASPMKSAVASSTPGFTAAGNTYSYNLDKAKSLLKEAGLPNGFTFDFTLGGGFDDWKDDAVLIQAELAKIGVTMNIKSMARPQFLEALSGKKVQAYISRWTSFVNDPGYHLGLLMTSKGSSNYMNYSNPEVDALWQKAANEPDQATRNALYAQAQQIITTQAPWAYLYEYNIVLAARSEVQGYTSYPDGLVRFFQMSIKK